MVLKLISTETLVAYQDMSCDSVTSYFDMLSSHTASGTVFKLIYNGDVAALFRNRKGVIKKGEKYIHREFVNEADGEVLVFNSIPEMDVVCKRNNIYHQLINNQIKANESNH